MVVPARPAARSLTPLCLPGRAADAQVRGKRGQVIVFHARLPVTDRGGLGACAQQRLPGAACSHPWLELWKLIVFRKGSWMYYSEASDFLKQSVHDRRGQRNSQVSSFLYVTAGATRSPWLNNRSAVRGLGELETYCSSSSARDGGHLPRPNDDRFFIDTSTSAVRGFDEARRLR